MAYHPLNLFLRLVLELIAFFAPAYWAWKYFSGWEGSVLAIFLPLMVATIWGVFAVPGDRSRSGKTVVKTAGWCRLLMEGVIFAQAVVLIFNFKPRIAVIYAVLVVLHHVLSIERIHWLMRVR